MSSTPPEWRIRHEQLMANLDRDLASIRGLRAQIAADRQALESSPLVRRRSLRLLPPLPLQNDRYGRCEGLAGLLDGGRHRYLLPEVRPTRVRVAFR